MTTGPPYSVETSPSENSVNTSGSSERDQYQSSIIAVAKKNSTSRDESSLIGNSTTSNPSLPGLPTNNVVTTVSHGAAQWKVILLGQALSLALATIGSTSTIIDGHCELAAPTFQMALVYTLMALRYVYLMIKEKRLQHDMIAEDSPKKPIFDGEQDSNGGEGRKNMTSDASGRMARYNLPYTNIPLSFPCHMHYLIAFLHVEGNYFTLSAYRYTSFKSISLLDSVAIPAAMLSSRWLLKRSYGKLHLVGVFICIFGSILMVTSDAEQRVEHTIIGDLLAIVGALLYGLNDVLAEIVVKDAGLTEYFGMLGLFGSLISMIQIGVLESEVLVKYFDGTALCSGSSSFLLLAAFVGAAYVFFIGMGHFLIVSEAALFNLSMLTGDVWAVLFSVFEEKEIPTKLFFISLTVTVLGVFVYEMSPSPIIESEDSIDEGNQKCSHDNCDLALGKVLMQRQHIGEISIPDDVERNGCLV